MGGDVIIMSAGSTGKKVDFSQVGSVEKGTIKAPSLGHREEVN